MRFKLFTENTCKSKFLKYRFFFAKYCHGNAANVTICTVWLKSRRSAVTRPIWSMSRCFLEKKRCRRPLSERHDATLDLYSSLSRFTTRGRQWETGDERADERSDWTGREERRENLV